ncbi:MAG: hypothetical protein NTX61_07770 [Bacteroidetes bacterium]|nr:hypothetical protein [Bacteroidota bacterium]
MSVNFFREDYKEPPLNNALFGLCDDQNGTKAYTKLNESHTWIATVKNSKRIPVVFTSIDKCVINDNEYPGRGRCDGMLTFSDSIYFVELKDMRSGWLSDAKQQLVSTIKFFIEAHGLHRYKHKKAFACNRRHRHFQEIDNEENLSFFRTYGVRIDVQAEILVV